MISSVIRPAYSSSATAPWPSRPGEVRIRMQLAPIRETGPGLLNSGSEFGEAWLLPPAREHRVPTRSEEHTSEFQSLMRISYAVFCLKKKKKYLHHTKSIYLLTYNTSI